MTPFGLARSFTARPRLLISAGVAVAVGLLLPASTFDFTLTRWLVAWNVGAWLYICLAAAMMARSSQSSMRRRALREDEGQMVILFFVTVSVAVSLAAIAGELAVIRDLRGSVKLGHGALAALTVLSSWGFTQVMFALHYAHKFYADSSQNRPGGLVFPGDEEPGYDDFFYLAAVIGTSGQTADVAFVSRSMRRVGTLHCILAYLFNTMVLALLINIGASAL